MKIEAILAHSTDYVIGKGDGIPWHHTGDFKLFRQLTKGNALLMGARTFLGIMRNYYPEANGKQVLPERTIFIVGKPRGTPIVGLDDEGYHGVYRQGYGSDWIQLANEIRIECGKYNVDSTNLRVVVDNAPPAEIIKRIYTNYAIDNKILFIAGGASIYEKYLEFAETIHQTVIHKEFTPEPDLVKLAEKTIQALCSQSRTVEGMEVCNGLAATYITKVQ